MAERISYSGPQAARPVGAERRTAARFACRSDGGSLMTVSHRQEARWARARDVSTGGLGLEVSGPFEPGLLVLLQINQRNGHQPLALLAEVVHATPRPDGLWLIGVRFDNLPGDLRPAEREELQNALRGRPENADDTRERLKPALAQRLRNPFNPFLESLLRSRLRQAKQARAAGLADWQGKHTQRRGEDLFDLFLLTRDKLRLHLGRVDLRTIVAGARAALRPLLEAQRQPFSVALPAKPLRLKADPARLERALINLLLAAAHSPEGKGLWLTAVREGDQVVLRIGGPGVEEASPDFLPNLQDLFADIDKPADRGQNGLRIGLALARALVEKHGGTVHVHSPVPGRGGEFVVRLPLLKKE
jgi:signal transduction histidine kinase